METSYCAFLQNVVEAKEDQSPEPLGFLWPCLRLDLKQVIRPLVFCPPHKRASFQLPRDVMGIKLITDWPKLLIFLSSVFSFQKSLLVCRFGIPAHFKAKG